jgi:choice-of-anchor C domain-containing protein
MNRRIPPALLAALLLITSASAEGTELITNGGFESGVSTPFGGVTTLAVGSTALTGWTVTRAPINVVDSGYWETVEGSHSVGLNPTATGGGLSQDFATDVGGTYLVRFLLSGEPFTTPVVKSVRFTAAGQSRDFNFDSSQNWHWQMDWERNGWSFVANASTTTLEFWSLTSGNASPAVDSLSVISLSNTGVTPQAPRLSLTVPGPVHARTDVRFTLTAPGHATVDVLDVTGARVATLADATFPGGANSLAWSAANKPAGIYFIALRAEGQRLVRRVALLP